MKKFFMNAGMSESMLRRKSMGEVFPAIADALEQRNAMCVMSEAYHQHLISDETYNMFIENMAKEINCTI